LEELGCDLRPFNSFGKESLIGPVNDASRCAEEDIDATAVELPASDLREIETASVQVEIQGARYPKSLERMTGL